MSCSSAQDVHCVSLNNLWCELSFYKFNWFDLTLFRYPVSTFRQQAKGTFPVLKRLQWVTPSNQEMMISTHVSSSKTTVCLIIIITGLRLSKIMKAEIAIYACKNTYGHLHAMPVHRPLIPLVSPADCPELLARWQTSTFAPSAVELKLNWSTAPTICCLVWCSFSRRELGHVTQPVSDLPPHSSQIM